MSIHVPIPTPPHDATKYLNGDMAWTVPPGGGGGGGAVDSVFGRTGVVVATNGDYTASKITNTPAGNISSTTVQAALNELDTEKLAIADFSYTTLDDIPTNIVAIANLAFPISTGKGIYFTSAGVAVMFDLSAAGRALVDDADAAAQRTTLGLGSVENTALSTWAGSSNITTVGTISTGTWNATAITQAKSHASPDTDVGPTSLHHTLGTGANQATAGNDSRLSDARTPTAHAASHKSAGADSIKLDELAAPTDITTLNASTTAHGLAPKATAPSTGWNVLAIANGETVRTDKAITAAAVTLFDDTTVKAMRQTLLVNDRCFCFSFGSVDAAATALTTGVKLYSPRLPINATVTAWYLQIDSGTITVDIYKRAFGNTLPSSSDGSIFAGDPAVSSGISNSATGLSISLTAGDVLAFDIAATSTAKWVCLTCNFEPA